MQSQGISVTLNGVQVDDPAELIDFTQELIRDDNNRILRYDYPTSLTFAGDGYAILEAKYIEDYDNEVEIAITDFRELPGKVLARGVIKISNCTFNLMRHECEVQVDDFVFQRKIFARRQSPMVVTANETLDGSEMTSLEPFALTMFNVADGSNISTPRNAFDIIEVMAKLIEFLTDGEVGFSSPWYDSLPDDERMAIITGASLRDPTITSRAPIVTFQALFDELWKKDNLMLIVRDVNGSGSLELVHYDDTFVQDGAVIISDIADLERGLDFDQLYSRVKFGNSQSTQDFGISEPLPYIPFLTFFEETYNLPSAIGVDKELNLTGRWLVDTNQISAALDGEDDNDGEIFIIQYDRSSMVATKGQYYLSTNPDLTLYNERLLNSSVAGRFNYLSDLLLNSGVLGSSFFAGNADNLNILQTVPATDSAIVYIDAGPHPFPDDSTPPFFNENNVYDNGTFTYTAPATGIYRFRMRLEIVNLGQLLSGALLSRFTFILQTGTGPVTIFPDFINLTNFDSGDNFVGSSDNPLTDAFADVFTPITVYNLGTFPAGWRKVIIAEQSFPLQEGDTVAGQYLIGYFNNSPTNNQQVNIRINERTFRTVTTPLSGGTYEPGDPDRFFIGRYTAEHVTLNELQAEAIMTNPERSFTIDSGNNDPRIVYPQKITRNLVTGKTDIEAIFNRKQAII